MFTLTEVWRDLYRNRGKSFLVLVFGILVIFCIAFYIGNIQNNEAMLRNLSQTIPVTVQVVGTNGKRQAGLEIDQKHMEVLLSGGISEPLYTMLAGGNIDEKNQKQPIKYCDTSIIGINSSSLLSPLVREQISYAQEWDESFFTGDQPACVISTNYASRHHISLGDTIEFPLYVWEYEEDDIHFRFLEVGKASLVVAGTYVSSEVAAGNASDVAVPARWLQSFLQDAGLDYTYASFQGTVADPLQLNEWKAGMKKAGFQEVDPDSFKEREGNALEVNDRLFIETADRIQENIRIFRWFQAPFLSLIVLLIVFILFLVLRSSRREIAIALSLGRPGFLCALRCFLENALLMLLGCVATLPVLLAATSLGLGDILVMEGIFLVCAFLSIIIALAFLFSMNVLELLTKID